ncbi:hypothetical protein [Roseiconus lacunae]|uniref:Uncharacterized protein n=1 Tax=Roseiconus lacunae TaxID=2605694 RepID=A0ABT7PHH3_9BACT|nr:hypothetical protein [Roseiconus lacunae]MDM4015933.1 hypothetical protein [Roseiconus lacunae]
MNKSSARFRLRTRVARPKRVSVRLLCSSETWRQLLWRLAFGVSPLLVWIGVLSISDRFEGELPVVLGARVVFIFIVVCAAVFLLRSCFSKPTIDYDVILFFVLAVSLGLLTIAMVCLSNSMYHVIEHM